MRINYFNRKLSEIRNWHFVFTPCSICFIDFSPFAPVFLLLSPSCSRGICNFALRERLVRSSSGKLFMACRVSRRTARVFAFTGRRVSPVRNNLGSRGSCRFVRPAVKSFAWVSSSRRSHFRSRSPVAQEIRLADFSHRVPVYRRGLADSLSRREISSPWLSDRVAYYTSRQLSLQHTPISPDFFSLLSQEPASLSLSPRFVTAPLQKVSRSRVSSYTLLTFDTPLLGFKGRRRLRRSRSWCYVF